MHETEHDFLRLDFMFQDFVDIFMSGGLRDPNDPFLRYILVKTSNCWQQYIVTLLDSN